MSLVLPQLAAVGAALAVAALVPPPSGRLLLVPLAGAPGAGLRLALAAGARLASAGPVAGSAVVVGERRTLWRAELALGTLVLAAPAGGCGGAEAGR